MVLVRSLLFTALAAGAAPAARSGSLVQIGVQVIEASTDASTTDAPASRAARDLSSTLNYKSYRTLAQEDRTLAIDEWATLTLANGATLSLSPKAIDGRAHTVRLQVSVHQGKHHLDTDYTVRDGGTVFVSAGPNGKNVLVLAIVPKAR
jgi:hypothetical protein